MFYCDRLGKSGKGTREGEKERGRRRGRAGLMRAKEEGRKGSEVGLGVLQKRADEKQNNEMEKRGMKEEKR